MKNMIMRFTALSLAILISLQSFSFCGFYVAKADANLFNNKSEVIIVRDGIHNVITMSSDFQGNMRDFAMVVPVPVVLKEADIKVVDRRVFDVLNEYSAPRLVEYYDQNPCARLEDESNSFLFDAVMAAPTMLGNVAREKKDFGVTVEAQYQIEEYDILILSATESTGLKDWLIINGYRIPASAEEVLQPYIKSNMKFFVVKVNMDKMQNSNFQYLRPLQISFDHIKFMLPLRLGMANSQGSQDMIVYGFSRTGRIECTNYRTVKLPTERNIPLYVQAKFGDFYKALFEKSYLAEGRNAVFLEYAWNVSPYSPNPHCDPCVGPPPVNQDFVQAGVNWLNEATQPSSVFFTRLHVRYSRDKFPADLQFQVTPNDENFQCRYILTHPATGPFDCEEAQNYLDALYDRRKREIDEVYALTGWSDEGSRNYQNEFVPQMKSRHEPHKKNEVPLVSPQDDGPKGPPAFLVSLFFMTLVSWFVFSRVGTRWLRSLADN